MKNKYLKQIHLIYIIIFIVILVLDRSSKNWIINHIDLYGTQKIFSVLNFFHVHNYGIAFSLLSNVSKSERWLLSWISTFVISILVYIMIRSKKKEKNKTISYCFIVSGAIGNLIDRIFYGFVIDFIDVHIYNWHFATFNIADTSIFFGMLIMIKKNFKKENSKK